MSNSERFLNAYAAIEHEMQRILDLKEHRRFYDLLDMTARVHPVINRYKFDLKEFADLRNAIVHDRADGRIIAEPNDFAVESIEKIAAFLLEPPKVVPLFQKPVLTLPLNEPVGAAVKAMSRHSCSQVPVLDRGVIAGMITAQMIVRWLGVNLDAGELNLEETTLADIVQYAPPDACSYRLVSAGASLFEVLDLFYHCQAEGGKLEAVLITRRGEPGEPLIGIITNRDLPVLQRQLEQGGRG